MSNSDIDDYEILSSPNEDVLERIDAEQEMFFARTHNRGGVMRRLIDDRQELVENIR